MAEYVGNDGNNIFYMQGSLEQFTVVLVNPYSGDTITIDEEKFINDSYYHGHGGFDRLIATNNGDVITLVDSQGAQMLSGIELITMGDGGDVIVLSDEHIEYNDVSVYGGMSDDIIWTNVGDDEVYGGWGNDVIDTGPGNDIIHGEEGNDILAGGSGNDTYVYAPGAGDDAIMETGGDDVIRLQEYTLGDLSFAKAGDNLLINLGDGGTITVTGHFADPGNIVETIEFGDASTFDLASIEINSAPVAADDVASGAEDSVITGNVLGNDVDIDGDVLQAVPATITTAAGATVELLADGSFTYTPVSDYNGADSFEYVVTDGELNDTGTVWVTVAGVNDLPTLTQFSGLVGTADEDVEVEIAFADLAASGDEADADGTVEGFIVKSVSSGTLRIGVDEGSATPYDEVTNNRIDGTNHAYWTPDENANGELGAFSVVAVDNDGAESDTPIEAKVNVTAVNDAPTVETAILDASTAEDAAYSYDASANFTDVDAGDVLTYSATQEDGSALPGWLTIDEITGVLSGTPSNDDIGVLNVKVTATDLAGASVSDVYQLTVTNENDAPTVETVILDASTAEDAAYTYAASVNFTDVDAGDELSFTATQEDGSTLPGWLSIDEATGVLSGTPTNGDVGVLNVKVTATDLAGASVSDVYQLTVTNENDAPTVETAILDASTAEDALYSYDASVNFTDVDAGDELSFTATQEDGSALPGWLTIDSTSGVLSGTPTNGDVGTINVKVTATDLAGASVSDTYVLTVTNVNNTPTVVTEIADGNASEDAHYSYDASVNFEDVDEGEKLSYSATLEDGSTLPGWLTIDETTSVLSGTPLNEDVGVLNVTVTATDLAGASVSDTYVLTVANTNDAPVVSTEIADASTPENAPYGYDASVNFEDVDAGDELSYSATLEDGGALPSWLTIDETTGELSGTPMNGDVGSINVTVMATDLAGASVSDTYRLTVTAASVNTPPQLITALSDTCTPERVLYSYDVSANFEDGDPDDTLTYSAMLEDGSTLPDWLTIDAGTGILAGTPEDEDTGVIDVTVTATDSAGATASDTFVLTVADSGYLVTEGDDILIGGYGDDVICGSDGNDTIVGFSGDDILVGGTGKDTMLGGKGDDTYYVDSENDVVIELWFRFWQSGNDTVISSVDWTLGFGFENLELTGTENLEGTGNFLNNMMTGNAGDNRLEGLFGNDTLDGAAGNDMLNGGWGNDVLTGGEGADYLTGGRGRDIFRYTEENQSGVTAESMDTISDFAFRRDKIDLSGIDADTTEAGDQAFSGAILGNTEEFSEAGELRFDSASSILYGNTDADADPEFAIELLGVTAFDATALLL